MLYGVFENDRCISIVESGEPEDALPKAADINGWPRRYKKVDGKVVDLYKGVSDVDAIEEDNAVRKAEEEARAAEISALKKAKSNKLSRLEFLSRFTVEERISLRQTETTDPFVAILFDMIRVAEFIDLNDQTTIDGINYLASKEYISTARAAEILS